VSDLVEASLVLVNEHVFVELGEGLMLVDQLHQLLGSFVLDHDIVSEGLDDRRPVCGHLGLVPEQRVGMVSLQAREHLLRASRPFCLARALECMDFRKLVLHLVKIQ